MRKVPALKALFSKLFSLSADKDYLLHVQLDGNKRSVTRPLSPVMIRTLTGISLFLAAGLVCLFWEVGNKGLKELRYQYAASRHGLHLSELRKIQSDLQSIESSLDDAFDQEHRMRALYGASALGASQKAFGIGGRAHPEGPDLELSQGLYENLFHTQLKGRQLRGKIEYTLKNFNEIKEFMDYRHNVWDHTPSVAPAPGNWTSKFGYRVHPITRRHTKHKGLDIGGTRFTPIYATANGVVSRAGRAGGYGNMVVLKHGDGYETRYAHLHRILVKPGEKVKRYDLVGYMGSTGLSTGVHLHYEVLRNGVHQNPEAYILPAGLIVD